MIRIINIIFFTFPYIKNKTKEIGSWASNDLKFFSWKTPPSKTFYILLLKCSKYFKVWLNLYKILTIFMYLNTFIMKIYVIKHLMTLITHHKYNNILIFLYKNRTKETCSRSLNDLTFFLKKKLVPSSNINVHLSFSMVKTL